MWESSWVGLSTQRQPRPAESETDARPAEPSVELGGGINFAGVTTSIPLDDLLRDRKRQLKMFHPVKSQDAIGQALDTAGRRLQYARRTRLFLSYPTNADKHVRLLKELLPTDSDEFEFDDYSDRDGEIIVDVVRNKIAQADCFIGIWQHEEPPSVTGDYGLSPWMPFEYGIAMLANKPAIVVHSDKVPERIWKRINAGVSHPEYSDVTFAAETIPTIRDYIRRNIRTQ